MNTTRKVLLFVCLSILVFSVTVFAATSTGLPRDKTLIVNMLTEA